MKLKKSITIICACCLALSTALVGSAVSWDLSKYPGSSAVAKSYYVGYGEQYIGISSYCTSFSVQDNMAGSPCIAVTGAKIPSFNHYGTGTRSVNYTSQPNSFVGVNVTYTPKNVSVSARVIQTGTCINK